MSYLLSVQSEALLDMQEAFEWYEMQQPSLGYEFIVEVEAGFAKIINHPHHYTSFNDRFCRLKVNRFPYLLVYEIEESVVFINAVRHIGQNPTI